MSKLPTLLYIDEDSGIRQAMHRDLKEVFDLRTASTIDDAQSILQQEWVQVMLVGQYHSDIGGGEFLEQVQQKWPEVIRMIVIDQIPSGETIDTDDHEGIYQYISRPWRRDDLILTLRNATRLFELQRKNEALSIGLKMVSGNSDESLTDKRSKLHKRHHCDDGMVRTANSCMNEVCEKLRQVAPYDVSVLLSGESGTGKELAARSLHQNSLRWNKPFVVENCGALPDELLESELFDYIRGAFTGATEDRVGLLERASGGTVFLDEIGEVSPAFQVKLLRVLQEGEIRPLGSGRTRKVDVRIIAATNRDLDGEVSGGRFREDLYYRLATVTVSLPPLRERRIDIPVLANSLLESAMQSLDKRVTGFTDEAVACMQAFHWPGNVRELQNEVRHMLVMGRRSIGSRIADVTRAPRAASG